MAQGEKGKQELKKKVAENAMDVSMNFQRKKKKLKRK